MLQGSDDSDKQSDSGPVDPGNIDDSDGEDDSKDTADSGSDDPGNFDGGNNEDDTNDTTASETRLDVDLDFIRNELESSGRDCIPLTMEGVTGLYWKERIAFTMFLYFLLLWKSFYLVSGHGMNALLFVLYQMLNFLGVADVFKKCCGYAFPKSMYMLRKLLKVDRNDFERYVVCQTCYKLFSMEDCKAGRWTCDNKRFAKGKFAKACDTELGYKAVLKDGSSVFHPYKVYCYRSVLNSLEGMLTKPQVDESCEHWRKRDISRKEMGDVYDGRIWKHLKLKDSSIHLAPTVLCLTVIGSNHSKGVMIFLSVLYTWPF